MNKFFSLLGYSILLFLVVSNFADINISNFMVIILAAISAIFMCISIIIKNKKSKVEDIKNGKKE